MSVALALSLGCAARQSTDRGTKEPTDAEPVARSQPVFVEVQPPPPQETGPEPGSPEALETAKRMYEEAVLLFESGDAMGALALLEEVYRLTPMPEVLYNIARIREHLGDVPAACEAYRGVAAAPTLQEMIRKEAATRAAVLNCP